MTDKPRTIQLTPPTAEEAAFLADAWARSMQPIDRTRMIPERREPVTHSGGKPHTNVGDRGQRYEVRSAGYPKSEETVVGWASTLVDADDMAKAFREHPSCLSTTIFDRQENKPVITRFAGILR